MKLKFTYLFLGLITVSCGTNKIQLENIQNIAVEYDKTKAINYGDSVRVDFYSVQLSGERTNISNSFQLEIIGDGLRYERKNNYLYIEKKPFKKDIDRLPFSTTLSKKDDVVTFQHELNLNFSGPLHINVSGEDGDKGRDRMSRLRPALLSDGKDGRDGDNGLHGKDGPSLKVHIWKNEDMYYVRLKQTTSDTVYYYQTTNKDNMVIQATGGNGGRGGDGGNGSRGKKGKKTEDSSLQPGVGGDGGDGGNGGNGGKGGSLEVIVHPSAVDVLPTLKILNHGGAAGIAGKAGEPGKAGKPASGQKAVADGKKGKDGKAGLFGENGPQPVIKTEDFNFNNL